MNGRELRNALHSGKRVFGTLIVSESPRWPSAISGSGLDFVFIDTEHTSLTNEQVAWMCQAYGNMNLAPIVRIPSPDPNRAANTIDIGAAGVIAPYVETVEQAKSLRGAIRLRPLKGRRFDAILDGDAELEPELASYLAKRNDEHVLIVNIESVPAVESLDSILSVPGIDGVLIGPHDLSCSLGIPEQYDHPQFITSVQTIFRKAREHDVGAGIHFTGEVEEQIKWLNAGATMLIHSGDITLFAKHLRKDLQAIKSAVGIKDASENTEVQI
ncbi:MAG: aldolase/citrate lyase family protein [Planctomycetota bacterium]